MQVHTKFQSQPRAPKPKGRKARLRPWARDKATDMHCAMNCESKANTTHYLGISGIIAISTIRVMEFYSLVE